MNNKASQPRPQYFVQQLVILTTLIMLSVTAILYNNSLRSASIFLFLLAIGISIQAVLGMKKGALLALLVCSVSVLIKQFIGAWEGENLEFNLLEVFLMAVTFILAGSFNDALRSYFEELSEAKQKLRILDLEDSSVGLIRPAIGLLRLKEEVERAVRFKRPIVLVLILTTFPTDRERTDADRHSVMRAVATTVKDTTRVLDIPFMVSEEKIGLILVDTEINGANKVINNIQRRFVDTRTISSIGSDPLQDQVQIRFAYAVFLGHSSKPFDLMEAAELSLQRNIEMNPGAIFQNLFIDWETVGESPVFQSILSAGNAVFESQDLSMPVIENGKQE